MLASFFGGDDERALSFQTIWGAGGVDFELGTRSGTLINEDTVLQINTVFSAISLIANTVSTLPISSYVRRDGAQIPFRPTPTWVQRPDIDFPDKAGFYSAIVTSLLIDGNAYIRVFSNRRGEIANLTVLNPTTVEAKRNGVGNVMYEVYGEDKVFTTDDIVHIRDVVRPGQIKGISRTETLKQSFGLHAALDEYAQRFFGNGASSAGVIEFPGNLTADQAKNLADGFDARHAHRGGRSHKTGVLSGGAKYVQTSVDPDKTQSIESRKLEIESIARVFNIPFSFLVPGTSTFASQEQQSLNFVKFCIRPMVEKIEGALSPLMSRTEGGENAYVKFTLDGLLRADYNTRVSGYSTGLQAGFFSVNDIRRFEGLRPIDDENAETVRLPLANVNVENAGLSGLGERARIAQRLVLSGYDPDSVSEFLGIDITHSGVPSTQLQPLSQLDPNDPMSLYEVDDDAGN